MIKQTLKNINKRIPKRNKTVTKDKKKAKRDKKKFKLDITGLKMKNTLLRKLVTTSTLVIIFSLVVSNAIALLITRDKIIKDFKASTIQVLNQNKNYIELINDTVDSTSMQLFSNKELTELLTQDFENDYNRYLTKNKLEQLLKNFAGNSSSSIIKSIYVFNDNKISVTTDSSSLNEDALQEIKNSEWYAQATKDDGRPSWSIPHKNSLGHDDLTLSYSRVLKDFSAFKACGILQINIDPNLLNSALKNAKIGQNGYIYIVDNKGRVISHKDPELLGKQITDSYINTIKDKELGDFTFSKDGKKMYGVYTTSKSTGWKFIAIVPESELSSSAKNISIFTCAAIIICLIISLLISIYNALQVTKPLEDIIKVTHQLSNGDFTVECKENKLFEINELNKNFNNMIFKLKSMFATTSNLAEQTDNSAKSLLNFSHDIKLSTEEISCASTEIADGSSKQTETAVTCVEISNSFNYEITNAVNTLNKVSSATEDSTEIINNSQNTINNLNLTSYNNSQAMAQVASTIMELSANTKDILTILNKIHEITDQTNLLALNASIEAARAGEAGRGFSVVATEIRKLAEESQKASYDIKKIIDNVNNSIKLSLNISDTAQKAFKQELEQVNMTIQSFKSIEDSIGHITEVMDEATNSIKLIDTGKDILNKYINNIAEISQKNTAATEEVTASIQTQTSSNDEMYNLSQKLNNDAANLKKIIDTFKF